jgi:hypothetical protein
MRSDENFDASTSGPPSYCPQGVNTVKMILVTAWACARIRGTLGTRRKYQDLWDASIGAHRQMLASSADVTKEWVQTTAPQGRTGSDETRDR